MASGADQNDNVRPRASKDVELPDQQYLDIAVESEVYISDHNI